jgi:hypothetical protein
MRDRPVAETSTWQHKHCTRNNIHAPGGIRTHDPSKPSAADPRLRPRDSWSRENKIPPKCLYISTGLHGVTSHQAVIFSQYHHNSCSLWISNNFEILISTIVSGGRLRPIYSGFNYHQRSYPTPAFPGMSPRNTRTKLLLQFSSVIKSSSTIAAVGCDVNGEDIAGYFPSPRANRRHAYSWIRNATGTMNRQTMHILYKVVTGKFPLNFNQIYCCICLSALGL